MKIIKNLSIFALMALLVTFISCNSDEEPTTPEVEDNEAPVVSITAPVDGAKVSTLDATTSITIKYEATDDVELASIAIEFDGSQLAEVTSFTDFRSVKGEQVKEDVADGEYTITVTATDKSGKTTSATSTFTKVTSIPYTALANEVLYMAFEGNYLESVNEIDATVVGAPDFAGVGKEGDNAYAGATDAYLTLPTTDLQSTELTASFYMKINNDPDRAGILIMGPPDAVNTDFQNNRTAGFRFFREAAGANQRFKLNVGIGESEIWLDGGELADVDPTVDEWHHFAFVIGATTAAVYIDGARVAQNVEHTGMVLAGCDILSIMSGLPRFTEWGHGSDLSMLDDLKIFNKAMTEAELSTLIGIEFGDPVIEEWDPDPKLTPVDGPDATEVLYMSFDTDFSVSVSSATATVVGTPTVVDGGVSGKAYKGALDSYLTLPTEGLLNNEFSASFWVKVNNAPDRAGIIVIGPEDTGNASYPDVQNLRTSGFRFFREAAAADQRYKINVGNGTADSWVDGGEYADIPADATEWRHVAFTVSATTAQVYLNGILVTSSEMTGLDWTGCDKLSFGSGAPRFTEWNHKSDESMFDELRIYNGVLNPAQIAALKAVGN